MVAFTLKGAGCEVVEAVDGEDGLNKAKSKPFNLVLTDQNMPKMDGITLIKSLRAIPQYKNTDSGADYRGRRHDEIARQSGWGNRLAGETVRPAKIDGCGEKKLSVKHRDCSALSLIKNIQ